MGFKNKPTGGYRSKFEFKLAKQIKRAKKPVNYEDEESVMQYVSDYSPDFTFEKKAGGKMYIEAKGRFDKTMQTKMRKVKRDNPDADIRFVFQANNKIKGTKSRYMDWAKRNKFPAALYKIPKEWLDETV